MQLKEPLLSKKLSNYNHIGQVGAYSDWETREH